MNSSINPSLLEILACPCPAHASVELLAEQNQIICTKCETKFPIKDGIPVMLLDEAEAGPNGIGG